MQGLKKEVEFLGDSLKRLREFPDGAMSEAGFQLDKVQNGETPSDYKPMKTIGQGAHEIRIRDSSGAYRVFYIANLADTVYVLHCFQKKTGKTSQKDLDIGQQRYRALTR